MENYTSCCLAVNEGSSSVSDLTKSYFTREKVLNLIASDNLKLLIREKKLAMVKLICYTSFIAMIRCALVSNREVILNSTLYTRILRALERSSDATSATVKHCSI